MNPRPALTERPGFQLMDEQGDLGPHQDVGEFWNRGWNAASKFITADAGKDAVVVLRLEHCCEMDLNPRSPAEVGRHRSERVVFKERRKILRVIDLDVQSLAAPLRLHERKVRTLVPIWLAVVVIGQRVQPRTQAAFVGEACIGHANDGRRIHATTEFGKNGLAGTQTPANGIREYGTKVFLIFKIGAIPKECLGQEFPILSDHSAAGLYLDETSRGNREDSAIRSQVGSWEKSKPAGKILIVER